MRLGIVGHAAEKFTPRSEARAKEAILEACLRYRPSRIVSGRSPMGGVDLYAEEIAAELGIPTDIFPPRVNVWSGAGGFKERNLNIAANSDLVLVVVVEALPPGFKGMSFKGGCYHCRGRNPPHVKSGGCWTAWKCNRQEWRIIGEPSKESA